MKKQILSFILGAVVALGVTMVPAVAESITQKIDVLVDYVTVTLDGEKIDVRNFVHKGTTYLSLRDTAEILGLQVDWDEETKTAILTSPGKTPVWPAHKQVIEIPIVKPTTMTIDGKTVDSSWIKETYDSYKEAYPTAADSDIKNAIIEDAKWEIFSKDGYEKYGIVEKAEYKTEAEKIYAELVESYGGEEQFALIAASSGVDVVKYKEEYIKSYINSQLITEFTKKLIENDEELIKLKAEKKAAFDADSSLAVYPKATVKHILVPNGDNAEKDAKAVVARLDKGENFEKVLEEFIQNDPGQPETGYEVEKNSQFVPEFEEGALKLKKGEYSQPVKTEYGYHIIYCLEKTETIEFEEYFETNFTQEINDRLNAIYSSWAEKAVVNVNWGF